MAVKSGYTILLLFLTNWGFLFGQINGLHLIPSGKTSVEVPFQYINNFIVVDVVLNKFIPLKFIFDTGAEYTLINKREIVEALGMTYEREFKVLGSDMSTELTVYLVRKNLITMGQMEASSADLLVLKEDYFPFEKLAGLQIHGIMGANFFKHLIVQIDYQRRILTFQYPENGLTKNQLKNYQQVPIIIKKNKVYIHSHAQVNPDTLLQLSLLLDSGAGITSLLYSHSHPNLNLPKETIEGNLAMGLGGFLRGYLGRMHRLELGGFHFNNMITSFQELTIQLDTTILSGRHGIIGNKILSRFKIIIDYPREKLYLCPIKKYNKGFKFDKSGLGVIAAGEQLSEFRINYVLPDSPADLAGLKVGDFITKINFFGKGFLTLSDIGRLLEKRENKKVKMVVRRNGERLKFNFRLKELI